MRFFHSSPTSALGTIALVAASCSSGDAGADDPNIVDPVDAEAAAFAADCERLELDVGGGDSEAKTVKLLVLGDTGEGNEAQRQVAAAMDAKCEAVGGCTAVLLLGDNFYDVGVTGTDDEQWGPKFEAPYDFPQLNGLKFYATLGNHDYGMLSSGSSEAQVDYTYLEVGDGAGKRVSGKWAMPNTYYDVLFEHVHAFAMDTQDGSDTQKDDMAQRVACSQAEWKLVFGHHPRFTSGYHNGDNRGFDEIFEIGMFAAQEAIYCGADMFLAGHDHNMEFIDKGRDENCPEVSFMISGAGAKLRATRDKLAYPEDAGGDFQRFYQEEIEGFAYLEFNGKTLDFEFIDKNGKVLYSKTLAK